MACIAVNFPLRMTFVSSLRFCMVIFSMSFVSVYFFIYSVISLLINFFSRLFSLHVTFCVCFHLFFWGWFLLKFHAIVLRKDTWDNFCSLKFVEACFVSEYVVNAKKCSMCTRKECMCFFFLFDIIYWKYQLSITALLYHLGYLLPYWFSVKMTCLLMRAGC